MTFKVLFGKNVLHSTDMTISNSSAFLYTDLRQGKHKTNILGSDIIRVTIWYATDLFSVNYYIPDFFHSQL